MPTSTRKSPRGATKAAAQGPAPEANEKAAETAAENPYSRLAAAAQEIDALPAPTRRNGRASALNPLADLIVRSYDAGKPYQLPAQELDEQGLAKLKAAIRRAASMRDLGVTIRAADQGDEVVVTVQGKERGARSAKRDPEA